MVTVLAVLKMEGGILKVGECLYHTRHGDSLTWRSKQNTHTKGREGGRQKVGTKYKKENGKASADSVTKTQERIA